MKNKDLSHLSARLDAEAQDTAKRCFDVLNQDTRKSFLRNMTKSEFIKAAIAALEEKLKAAGRLPIFF